MYSPEVLDLLRAAHLSIGDRLRYTAGVPAKAGAHSGPSASAASASAAASSPRIVEGLLLPHTDIGDQSCLVLKLDSGYNVGLQAAGAKLEKIDSEKKHFSQTKNKTPAPPHSSSAPSASHPASPPPLSPASHRPPIHLLGTGGTIASKVDYHTGAVHPDLSADELIAAYPRLCAYGPIHARSLFSLLSEDIRPEHWTLMAKGVADAFQDGAAGVVIAHGTDTMGYSSAALSFALGHLPGPVVFTGAQRSPDRGSSDAALNLLCSSAAARADFAAVALCMHSVSSDGVNLLHWGTRVRKSHTSGRWAFRSNGLPPFGKVMADSGQVLMNEDSRVLRPPKRDLSRKISLHDKFSSNVHLAWIYPGINSKTVSSWSHYDGVVLAATGLGHAPIDVLHPDSKHSILPALRELCASGVVVAAAPQAMEGRINLDIYSTGRLLREAGMVGHGADWLPETAYVKMCWALGQQKDAKKAADLLLTPIAHDITERSIAVDGSEEPQ